RQVLADGRVEIELALVGEAHEDADAHHLARRGDEIEAVGVEGAVALLEDDPVVLLDDDDARPREPVVVEELPHRGVEGAEIERRGGRAPVPGGGALVVRAAGAGEGGEDERVDATNVHRGARGPEEAVSYASHARPRLRPRDLEEPRARASHGPRPPGR